MGGKGFVMDPDFVAAVARVAAGERVNVSRFCRDHGVNRDTFYRYVKRFALEGPDGFVRRSSAPKTSPTRLPAGVAEAVVRARKELDDEGRDNGPISIMWRLEDAGYTPLPSRSAIYRILVEHGLITRQPRKRPRTRRGFEYADPNGLWQIDGLETYLADGTKAAVIQILDDHSRYDVCCYAATSENGQDAWRALEQAFAGHGVPVRLLSDNGKAFSGKHRGYLADLERRAAAEGVTTIATAPYHPQTNGKNERAHATLRKWPAKKPVPETLTELQELLEDYRRMYNHRRHQGIGGQTPHQRYHDKPKAVPTGRPTEPAGVVDRPVSATGVVAFCGCSIVLPHGRRWAGRTARIHWQDRRVAIMIGDTLVRQLTLDPTIRYQRLNQQELSVSS
jgi:transposase InsO family protein